MHASMCGDTREVQRQLRSVRPRFDSCPQTSRNLKDRLARELERNLALRVEPGETADQFIVSGRGALHLGILIENMRREGYEFGVGAPTVITKEINGKKSEPYEEAVIEVPEEHMGGVATLMGSRKGEMKDMVAGECSCGGRERA